MTTVRVTCTPEFKDPSRGATAFYEESWEAVLFEHRDDDGAIVKSNSNQSSERMDDSAQEFFIVQLLESDRWEDLIDKVNEGISARLGGSFILHEACKKNPPPEAIKALLEHFPDTVRTAESQEKMLPLHIACKHGASHEVLMTLLLEHPDAVTILDSLGKSPRDYANAQESLRERDAMNVCLEMSAWVSQKFQRTKQAAELRYKAAVEKLTTEHDEEKRLLRERIQLDNSVHQTLVRNKDEEIGFLKDRVSRYSAKITSLAQEVESFDTKQKTAMQQQDEELAAVENQLDATKQELYDVKEKHAQTLRSNIKLRELLEQRDKDFNQALDEIDRLEARMVKMSELMSSIQHLAHTEQQTQEREAERRDSFEAEEYESERMLSNFSWLTEASKYDDEITLVDNKHGTCTIPTLEEIEEHGEYRRSGNTAPDGE